MALREYRCKICNAIVLAFDNELSDRLVNHHRDHAVGSKYYIPPQFELLPPRACIVHATEGFMSTTLQLDSINDIHDLESQKIREAAEEREMKEYQRAVGGS